MDPFKKPEFTYDENQGMQQQPLVPNLSNVNGGTQGTQPQQVVSNSSFEYDGTEGILHQPMRANSLYTSMNNETQGMQQQQIMPNFLVDEEPNLNGLQLQGGGEVANLKGLKIQEGGFSNTITNEQGFEQTVAIETGVPVEGRQHFDMADRMTRRAFVAKILTVLLIQNVLMLPLVAALAIFFDVTPVKTVQIIYGLVIFLILIAMYFFSDYRRHAPMNWITFVGITIILALKEAMYSMGYGVTALISPFMVIVQYLALLGLTKQDLLTFSNAKAMLLSLLVVLLCIWSFELLDPDIPINLTYNAIFMTMYASYDIQLQMSGHHGYNLQPSEHIFAATNVYADFPNLVYRFFKFAIVDHFIRFYQFLNSCCSAPLY